MGPEDRMALLARLEKLALDYSAALNTVTSADFRNLSAPPDHVAALANEVESTKTLMREFAGQIRILKQYPDNTGGWVLLLRNFYIVEPYMDDLYRAQLVKSDAYIGLRLYLPIVFDRIVLPTYLTQ